jgi:hypothetical protein
MLIYDTTLSQLMTYNGAWLALGTGSGTNWFNGSGAPSSSLGQSGADYLDDATGNIYQNTAGTWSVIYSPTSVGSLPLAGGTLTGTLHFSAALNPAIDFGSGWYLRAASTTAWSLACQSGAVNALQFAVSGSVVTTTFASGSVNLTGASAGYQVAGTQVVGAQQTHIAHDVSGAANQATVNAILAALEAHGLVHS